MKKSDADKRELELKRLLEQMQRRYEKEAEPIIKELAHILSLKPPAPITAKDGTVYQYIGPSLYDPE